MTEKKKPNAKRGIIIISLDFNKKKIQVYSNGFVTVQNKNKDKKNIEKIHANAMFKVIIVTSSCSINHDLKIVIQSF